MFNIKSFDYKFKSFKKIIYENFFNHFKDLYGRFFTLPNGQREYFLKLDGYYYCQKNKSFHVIIKVRNKRTIDKVPIQELVNDRGYLKELHPADACLIGILANNERNNLLDKTFNGLRKINYFGDYSCFIKTQPILYLFKKHTNAEGIEIVILRSIYLEKKIEIPTLELCKNQALLYALNPFQAISIGYDASEALINNLFLQAY